jgi:major membrane immunogen (membrane-anchored lipoprotein)
LKESIISLPGIAAGLGKTEERREKRGSRSQTKKQEEQKKGTSTMSVEDVRQRIYAKVMEKQSLQIDTVSGATVTTLTTLKAIENALSR